jgi:hypothetical protein
MKKHFKMETRVMWALAIIPVVVAIVAALILPFVKHLP